MLSKEILLATQDDAFQKLIAEDAILLDLESQKYNRQSEYFSLMFQIKQSKFYISGIEIKTFNLIKLSLLWILENAFVLKNKKVENEDIDIFMYLATLNFNEFDESLVSIYANSKDYCLLNSLDYDETKNDIYSFINLQFKAFEMLPRTNVTSNENVFDVDWLTHLTSIVCGMTNLTSEYVQESLSINTCLYYYVQKIKENDIHNEIKRKTSDEINEEIFRRSMQLASEYYQKTYGGK